MDAIFAAVRADGRMRVTRSRRPPGRKGATGGSYAPAPSEIPSSGQKNRATRLNTIHAQTTRIAPGTIMSRMVRCPEE